MNNKKKILNTALKIFAEKGFEGARVDEIADKAGVNKATIYYHFGSKEKLYKAILKNILSDASKAASGNAYSSIPPKEKIEKHIELFIEKALGVQYFAPLIIREVASGGAHLPNSALLDMAKIIDSLAVIIDEGRRKKIFAPANPLVIHLMITASLAFYFVGSNIRKRVSKIKTAPKAKAMISPKEMAEDVAGLINAGLTRKK